MQYTAKELARIVPHAKTIQLLSANPLALTYDRLAPRLELIRKYLPELEDMYTQTRVSDLKNKSVQELRSLKNLGMREISLGTESGDDWTLERINKGYTSDDILEQCAKLDEAAKGEFDPCSELELMIELKAFIENLNIDAERFITHHTSSTNLNCSSTFLRLNLAGEFSYLAGAILSTFPRRS